MAWYDDLPEWSSGTAAPSAAKPPAASAAEAAPIEHGGRPTVTVRPKNWYDTLPDWAPTPTATDVVGPVSTGEAFGRGMIESGTFGAAPLIAGASAAGATAQEPLPMVGDFPGLEIPAYGAAKLTRGEDKAATEAADKARKEMVARQKAAAEQHPRATLAGQLAGGLVTPGFGAGTAGTLTGRLATGALAGGIGGGLYGLGSAASEGKSLPEAAASTAENALIGGAFGGALKGVIGPRVAGAPSVGQQAGTTAARIMGEGRGLPRGYTEFGPAGYGLTSKVRALPGGGAIGERVHEVVTATGEHINEMARRLGGGPRADTGTVVQGGLQDVIAANKANINAAYRRLNDQIDQATRFTMPRTDRVLNGIIRDRFEAHWENPAEGLDQFLRAAEGSTFNGARRAQWDARKASKFPLAHPGYDAGDYRRIAGAMKADLREMAGAAAQQAGNDPQRAVADFAAADRQFERLARIDDYLQRLTTATPERVMGAMLRAASKTGGNIRVLAQLKQSMSPAEFEPIAGTMLRELGYDKTNNQFNLSKFVTNWNNVSDAAKNTLFSPQHLKDINDIAQMGAHLKRAMAQSNVSHTAAPLLMFEILTTAIKAGGELLTTGTVSREHLAEVGGGLGGIALAHWLASPSKAASMRAFGQAYRGALDTPTPHTMAVFKLATRNLAHNLNIPEDKILEAVGKTQEYLAPPPQDQSTQQQKSR